MRGPWIQLAVLLWLPACAGSGVLTSSPTPTVDDDDVPVNDDDDGDDDDDDATDPTDTEQAMTPRFSVDRGFYASPFELQIDTEEPQTTITWTLDGSDPTTSPQASQAVSPAIVSVDPTSTEGRDPTPGFVVRAFATKEDFEPSAVATHTYLFVEQVPALSPHDQRPGPDWPAPYDAYGNNDPINSIDYGMDPRVYEDPVYADLISDGLLAIPSWSISIDLEHLFDPATGIYMNAQERGHEWERPCALEQLDPADEREFGVAAGLRIRGGWSRHKTNPKHAFRLYFREQYGDAKLDFPLFDDEGVGHFDKIDLRTSQNYSWSFTADSGRENTMNRDVFSRDLQRELGRPYTRSRYVHLYLNGVYWGLFQTQERSEARYATAYFGGVVDDWDVIKVNQADRLIEAVDGSLDVWADLWELCLAGFEDDTNYQLIQGKGPDGQPDPSLRVLVDVDNLIDYMLVIFFTGNFDAPSSSFFHNQGPNNFFALYDRLSPDRGFVFFTHDSEHSLLADNWGPGAGLQEDRVNLATRTDDYRMLVDDFFAFHPQWLHFKLTDNPAYRDRFAARASELLGGGGLLTDEQAAPLFAARVAEIELAIIAESARWGDSVSFNEAGRTWRTRDDDWVPATQRVLEDWMPHRTAIVIEQLEAAALWPE